jgi:hypothetical protein
MSKHFLPFALVCSAQGPTRGELPPRSSKRSKPPASRRERFGDRAAVEGRSPTLRVNETVAMNPLR